MHKVETHMAAAGRPIHRQTMYCWKRKPWWMKLQKEIRKAKGDEFDAMATEAIHKSVGAVIDRLDNGDYHLDKEGGLVRVPVKAKDAAVIGAVLYDKRALGRGDPTSKVERSSPEDSLKKLADAFLKMTGGETIEAKKIETTYAVDDERASTDK